MLYKLQKHSLTRTAWIRPETLGTELNERNASATMTLGPEEPEIAAGDWILDTGTPGGQTVWRAKTIEFTPETGTRTITLEHIIRSLGDYLMFGDVNAETVSGGSSCPARDMARYILGYQTDWVLGRFDYDSSAGWEFNGEKLFDALGTVTGTLDGAWWAYDCSVYPFRLHVVNAGNYFTALSEMRGGRNIQSLRRTIDRSQMYTRFYPIGKDNLHITGDYMARNEDIYGTICKVETDQTKDTEEKLRAWADERLRKHCEPAVTVTISGVDLSGETGEDLDRLMLGRMCRVPVPEYGTVIRERITRLQWRDRMKEPEVVTVTLSNGMENVTSIQEAISEQASSSGRGGRGGAKQAGEDHAWFVDTEDHVAMVAEAIIGRDPEGNPVNWSRVSEIIVDGTGIHQQVVATAGELVTQTTRIDINERGIAAEIIDRQNADNTLQANITATAAELRSEYSAADGNLSSLISQTATEIRQEVKNTEEGLEGKITVQADRITQEVTRAQGAEESLSGKITVEADRITQEVTRATEAEGTLSGKIEVQANQIALRVSKGDVATQLAVEMGNVSVTGGNLTVSGMVTASAVSAALADLDNAYIDGTLEIRGWLDCGDIDCADIDSGKIDASGDITTLGTLTVGDELMKVADITVSGNTMTITYNDGRSPQTFSKATSLKGTWSGATFTVKATPQNETASTTIGAVNVKDGTALHSGSKSILDVPVAVADSDGVEHYTQTLNVNALAAYTAGKTDGAASVNKKVVYDSTDKSVKYASSGGSDSILISLNKGAVTGSGASGKRTISCAAGSVQVDSATITDYGDGYSAGYNTGFDVGGATCWLYYGTAGQERGTLGYNSSMNIGYKDHNGNWHYIGYWNTPVDRYDEGYADGKADAGGHSISAKATTGWTGSIAGRTSLGSITGSTASRTYILINVSCGGTSKGYYITVN